MHEKPSKFAVGLLALVFFAFWFLGLVGNL